MSASEEKQKYSAPAVRKVLDMLELMSKNDKSYSLSEIVDVLSISSNSAFRIFKELEAKGYVEKDGDDCTYELTPKLYYLGNSIRNRVSVVRTVYPYMKRILRYTNESVLFTKLDHNYNTIVVDQLESMEPIKFISTIGVAYDSYCSAMGKVMLAMLSKEELDGYFDTHPLVSKTPNTITNKDTLLAELKQIRERGIAYDLEENMQGLSCIAAPIFSSTGVLEGSIGISGLSFRITEELFPLYTKYIKEQAVLVSSVLGYETLES